MVLCKQAISRLESIRGPCYIHPYFCPFGARFKASSRVEKTRSKSHQSSIASRGRKISPDLISPRKTPRASNYDIPFALSRSHGHLDHTFDCFVDHLADAAKLNNNRLKLDEDLQRKEDACAALEQSILVSAAEARAADSCPDLAEFHDQKAGWQDTLREMRSHQQVYIEMAIPLKRQIAYIDSKIGRVLQHVFDTADRVCEEVYTGRRTSPFAITPMFSVGLKILRFYRDECQSNREELQVDRLILQQQPHSKLTQVEKSQRNTKMQQPRRREALIKESLRLREIQFLRDIAAVDLKEMADPVCFMTAENLEVHRLSLEDAGRATQDNSNLGPDKTSSLMPGHDPDHGRPTDDRFTNVAYVGKQAILQGTTSSIPPYALAEKLHECKTALVARQEDLRTFRKDYFQNFTRFFCAIPGCTRDDFEAQYYPGGFELQEREIIEAVNEAQARLDETCDKMRIWNTENDLIRMLSDSSFAGRTSDLNTESADVILRANASSNVDAGDIRTWHYAVAWDAEPSQVGVNIAPSEPGSLAAVQVVGVEENPAFEFETDSGVDEEVKVRKWMDKARELGFALR